MNTQVRITEVSPRDGLQNESHTISTAAKAELIQMLNPALPAEIEITSFVSPKWVPQLGDAAELCALIADDKPDTIIYSALVPNEKGMARVVEVNDASLAWTGRPVIDKVSVFAAASETFSQKNTNASIAETIERFVPVIAKARAAGLPVRGYVSCVIECPFEGVIEPEVVANVAEQLVGIGVSEIDLGDTIGKASPDSTGAMLNAVRQTLGDEWWTADRMTLHLHDTFGTAAECVRTALDLGLRSFDASAAGLGGCPYASTNESRAPGNIATSVLLDAIEAAGLKHGMDREALQVAELVAMGLVGETPE